jgi:hypothetical protein
MRKTGILVFLLLFTLGAFSQAPPSDPVQRLEAASFFAFGGVGFAGTVSPGEKDFSAVLALAPEAALKQFEEVYARGNPQGKSYALVGIRRLAPERFATLRQSLGSGTEKVETMTGCIADRNSLAKVVEGIANGRYGFSPKKP